MYLCTYVCMYILSIWNKVTRSELPWGYQTPIKTFIILFVFPHMYVCMYVCMYILFIWNKDVWKHNGQTYLLWEFMISYKLGCKMGIIATVSWTAALILFILEWKKQKQSLNLLTLGGSKSPSPSQKGWGRCAAIKEQGNNALSSKSHFCTRGCFVWTNECGWRLQDHCLWDLVWRVNNLMNEQFKHLLYLFFNLVYRTLPFRNYTYLTACWIVLCCP